MFSVSLHLDVVWIASGLQSVLLNGVASVASPNRYPVFESGFVVAAKTRVGVINLRRENSSASGLKFFAKIPLVKFTVSRNSKSPSDEMQDKAACSLTTTAAP